MNLVDELYLMNLLGHLKLAAEKGYEGVEEYSGARSMLGDKEPVEHLGHELASELARGKAVPPHWPQVFSELRKDLDEAYAATLGSSATKRRRATAGEIAALFSEAALQQVAADLELPVAELVNRDNVTRLSTRPEWRVPRGAGMLAQVQAVIQEAPRHIGDMDLVEWVAARLLSEQAQQAIAAKPDAPDPADYLYHALGPAGHSVADVPEEDDVAFGHGLLTPLLSYAALNRRLETIQSRVAKSAMDVLQQCDAMDLRSIGATDGRPPREIVELRVNAALELHGNYKQAVRLLARGRQLEESSGVSEQLAQIARILKIDLPNSNSESPAEERRLTDLNSPPAHFRWEPIAEAPRNYDRIEVTEASPPTVPPSAAAPLTAPERPTSFLSRFGLGRRRGTEPAPLPDSADAPPEQTAEPLLSVRGRANQPEKDDLLLTISGLSAADRALVRDHLATGFLSATGATVKQRLLNSSLRPPETNDPLAEAMDNVADGAYLPTSLLLARAIEVLSPRPLTEYGGDLVKALENAQPVLPLGDDHILVFPTLDELVEILKTG